MLIRNALICLALVATLSGCDMFDPNPPLDYAVVYVAGGDGAAQKIESTSAKFTCTPPIDPEECNYGSPDAGYDDGGEPDPNHRCMCKGVYTLSSGSLKLVLDGPSVVTSAILTSANGGVKQAKLGDATGTAEVFITKKAWATIDPEFPLFYYLTIAGGFTGDFGAVKLSSGYFFAINPEKQR